MPRNYFVPKKLALITSILTLGLFCGTQAKTQALHDQTSAPSFEEATVPECGLVSVCPQPDKTRKKFFFQCQTNTIEITDCGSDFTKTITKKSDCTGPSKSVEKSRFLRDLYNAALTKTTAQLSPLSDEECTDVMKLGAHPDAIKTHIAEAKRKLLPLLEAQKQFQGHLPRNSPQMIELREEIDVLSSVIFHNAEKSWSCAKSAKKLQNLLKDLVDGICNNPIHVVSAQKDGDQLIYNVLENYDPENALFINGELNPENITTLENDAKVAFQARIKTQNGETLEFYKDLSHPKKLVWVLPATESISLEEAEKYCEAMNQKAPSKEGKKWTLPSKEDLVNAFGNTRHFSNRYFEEALPPIRTNLRRGTRDGDPFFWIKPSEEEISYYSAGHNQFYYFSTRHKNYYERRHLNHAICVSK